MWEQEKDLVRAAQERERRLRQELLSEFFPAQGEGTATTSLPDGFRLRCTVPVNRTVDQAKVRLLLEGPLPLWLDGEALFPAKHTVSVREWKALTDIQQRELADIVTEREGAPSLEILEP